MAPEQLDHTVAYQGTAVDVWAAGVMLLLMLVRPTIDLNPGPGPCDPYPDRALASNCVPELHVGPVLAANVLPRAPFNTWLYERMSWREC